MIDRVGTKVRPAEREVMMVNLCPACHVDREVVREMLAEPPTKETEMYHLPSLSPNQVLIETENHAQARHIIENCPSCAAYFRTYVRKV